MLHFHKSNEMLGGLTKNGNGVAGEWWNANVIDVVNQALATGAAPNLSDAFTINGWPGDLYPCSIKRKWSPCT